jgi:integrase
MAQIIKRGTNRYLVRVFLGRDGVNGKRRYHSKTIRGTKRQAETYGTRVQHEVDTGAFREGTTHTVGEFLDKWLEETAKRRVRPRTYEGYREIIDTHLRPIVGTVKLATITHQDAQRVVDHLEKVGKAPGTIRNPVGSTWSAPSSETFWPRPTCQGLEPTIPDAPARPFSWLRA